MSQAGPIILVASAGQAGLASALTDSELYPVVDATWADARDAVQRLQPAAVIIADPDPENRLPELARQIAAREPYVPLIVVAPRQPLPDNALVFTPTEDRFERLLPRLSSALRVRTLHDTVLRRIGNDPALRTSLLQTDPLTDAHHEVDVVEHGERPAHDRQVASTKRGSGRHETSDSGRRM
jgi:hypothetical protein